MALLRVAGVVGGSVTFAGAALVAAMSAGLSALSTTPSAQGVGAPIPPAYLELYQAAAATCPGLPWEVLAGIGTVETDQGRDDHVSSAGAVGPMQFEPATFTRYDRPVPPGGADPPTPLDPIDAIYAAARDLCANGAKGGSDITGAVYAYNHDDHYVSQVLSDASTYGATSPPAAAAVAFAQAQIGVPYRWGGEGPGGFDCSGLTQAAYAAAGISIPRTSELQWAALPHVALGSLEPGDLVFFDPGEFAAGQPGHVGVYIGAGQFVDAPHTGATVRIDDLAVWGQPFGAARPG
jgi:cell wall-associated NlpC family hydrolase